MELLKHNRAMLERDDPNLLRAIEALAEVRAIPENTRKGELTLKYGSEYVHSKVAPIREVGKIVPQQARHLHLHFGLGLGHLLEADAPEPQGTIVVFEPNLEFLAAAMAHVPLHDLFLRKRAKLCWSLPQLKELLEHHLKGDQEYHLLALPYHAKAYPKLLATVKAVAQQAHYDSGIALRTLQQHAAFLTHHELVALPHTVPAPGVAQLQGRFKDLPAVIVSAGPSLDRNAHQLCAMVDHCVVIGITRTAKALERLGVRPHFLVHNEPRPFYHLIEHCQNLDDTAFVLASQAQKQFFEHKHRHTFVFQNPANFVSNWLISRDPQQRKGNLETGGSVSTEAFALAFELGCNPIIVLGQDLAVKDGQYYGHTQENKAFLHAEKEALEVPGYFGEKVISLSTYYLYARWFGEAAGRYRQARPDLHLINATEGGVALANFKAMKLRDAAWRFCRKKLDASVVIDEAARLDKPSELDVAALKQECLERLDALDALSKHFKPFARKLAAALRDPSPKHLNTLPHQLRRLDTFKEQYTELQRDFLVLSGFMQAELIEANRRKREQVYQPSGDELRDTLALTALDLELFAFAMASTDKAVARMRLALSELA